MGDYQNLLGKIKNREDFLNFMEQYIPAIENENIRDYLDSLTSWAADMDGYYINTNQKIPENINWDFIATLLYVGSIYE